MNLKFLSIFLIILSFSYAQQLKWIYTYNGTKDSADLATKIVHGDDGNLYIGGISSNILHNTDITVISLDTLGNQRWIYIYNYPGKDYLNDMIYIGGKIYLTGSLESEGILITICLNSNGAVKWIYTYDTQGMDAGNSIIYGVDGNLYIAGKGFSPQSNYSPRFMVISLDTMGNERWIKIYPDTSVYYPGIANYLTHDGNGNIYVSGYVSYSGSTRLVVISFDNLGNQKWIYEYSAPSGGSTRGNKVLYKEENIYLIGTCGSGGLVTSLDIDGHENWMYFYQGANTQSNTSDFLDIVFGLDGNLYVGGTTGYAPWNSGWITMSLASTGIWRWSYFRTVVGNCSKLIYNENGIIYALGRETPPPHLVIRSFSSINGQENWAYHYTGTTQNIGKDMVLNSNKLYIAGSQGILNTQDMLVICLEITQNEK
ncbi:MAG: hypothetical protein ABIM03_03685 [candidate division WOR-3 bacterium]